MRILSWVPEVHGGIATYGRALQTAFKEVSGGRVERVEIHADGGRLDKTFDLLAKQYSRQAFDLIHVQHEYGCFGSKVPWLYRWPRALRLLRRAFPGVPVVVTAHRVIERGFRYPVRGTGLQAPVRWVFNKTLKRRALPLWIDRSFGDVEGVIVHSRFQKETLESMDECLVMPRLKVIPHFVPHAATPSFESTERWLRERARALSPQSRKTFSVVFGFVGPEKGQDIAIEAFAKIDACHQLVIAGGARRGADRRYVQRYERRIAELGRGHQIAITGFVPDDVVSGLYAKADLVVAPFRETAGSGTLATAQGFGKAIVTSDIALNRELTERVPGCLSFFVRDNPESLATVLTQLLDRPDARTTLENGSRVYARFADLERVALEHLTFYREILGFKMADSPLFLTPTGPI